MAYAPTKQPGKPDKPPAGTSKHRKGDPPEKTRHLSTKKPIRKGSPGVSLSHGKSTSAAQIPQASSYGNILITGQYIDQDENIVYAYVDVPAGDKPPVITDGWPQFQGVARPQRVSISAFQGYNPWAIDIELRFRMQDDSEPHVGLGWKNDKQAGEQIELALEKLLWMAGRGPYNGGVGSQGVGAPPLLKVTTTDNNGYAIPLLEFALQGSDAHTPAPLGNSGNILWVVSNIDFSGATYRHSSGYRTWQDVKLSLTQYSADQFDSSMVQRAKANAHNKHKLKAERFNTHSSHTWTLMKIARKYQGLDTVQKTAQAILKANEHNRQMRGVRNVSQRLKPHTEVWIPAVR